MGDGITAGTGGCLILALHGRQRCHGDGCLCPAQLPAGTFFAIANRLSDRMAVGFSVDSPHGLSIEWKDHTWDIDLGASGKADMVKTSQLTVIRLGPSAAWKVSDSWSIGARCSPSTSTPSMKTISPHFGLTAHPQVTPRTRYRDENFAFGLALHNADQYKTER